MLARVPGPADREEIEETISAYATKLTWLTAATIGTVAWPPHVTMLRFGAPRCSSRLTTGTQYGPTAAGVRSSTRTPVSFKHSQLCRWAPAEVASNTSLISAKFDIASRPSTPSAVVGTPIRLARARPSDSASIPTIAPISRCSALRSTLIMRSVPMLPEPMIATGHFCALIMCPFFVRMCSSRNDHDSRGRFVGIHRLDAGGPAAQHRGLIDVALVGYLSVFDRRKVSFDDQPPTYR